MSAFTALAKLLPSYTEPRLLLSYTQRSGAFGALPNRTAEARIGTEDRAVYIHTLDMRSNTIFNQNPDMGAAHSATSYFKTTQISVPTYWVGSHASYNQHDIEQAAMWNVNLPDAYRKAAWQGFFQIARHGLLNGFTPSNGEGILNASGATAVSFPADANGHTTLVTMDPGWIFNYIDSQIIQALIRIQGVAQGPTRVAVTSSQRVIAWLMSNVVEITSFQRAGAGSQSIAGSAEEVMEWNGVDLEFYVDDTLQGAATGSNNDYIVINFPEVVNPQQGPGEANTNEFATLQPGLEATLLQYSDMPAPKEISAPLPGGYLDTTYEQRWTPGWVFRPEALTLVNVQYS